MDSDPDRCPECGAKIKRLISPSYAQYKGHGFHNTDHKIVKSASGQPARRVSETDLEHFEEGVRLDSKGRPRMTPTRPRPRT